MGLNYQTVTDSLRQSLSWLMERSEFSEFRLVGGTSMSLQVGHRQSDDIDLFTDANYESIDFKRLDALLKTEFKIVGGDIQDSIGFGTSYFIGDSKEDLVKLDLFYTEPFVYDPIIEDGIRMAGLNEIGAMKLQVIGTSGRKKDYWDLHELLNFYSMDELLDFHHKRYPYEHAREKLILDIGDFQAAENDPTPNCHRGKFWEMIKQDILYEIEGLL